MTDERTFVDAHGVEIFTRWWLVDAPLAIVLIAHGAAEHSGRYERFAQALNAAGYAAVALDQRGHGRTGQGTGVGMMGPGGGTALVDDLHELRASARASVGGDVPVVLFGHSLGSLIALAYLTRHADGLAGSILCGFPADINGVEAVGEVFRQLADAGMRDQPADDALAGYNTAFEPARTRYDWLSRDPSEVDKYVADPMGGDDNPLTFGYFGDIFDIVAPACDQLASISCPTFVIAGDNDPAGGMGSYPKALADALVAAGVPTELVLYPDARHELLNETNRDEVTADIINWFRARGLR